MTIIQEIRDTAAWLTWRARVAAMMLTPRGRRTLAAAAELSDALDRVAAVAVGEDRRAIVKEALRRFIAAGGRGTLAERIDAELSHYQTGRSS